MNGFLQTRTITQNVTLDPSDRVILLEGDSSLTITLAQTEESPSLDEVKKIEIYCMTPTLTHFLIAPKGSVFSTSYSKQRISGQKVEVLVKKKVCYVF